MTETPSQFLTALIDIYWFCIPVSHIIEVLHMLAFEPVPSHREGFVGFITIRNVVMPLVDFRRIFQGQSTSLRLDTPVIAIQTSCGPLALLFEDADRVEDLCDLQNISPPTTRQFQFVSGAVQQKGKVFMRLDTEAMGQELLGVPLSTIE